MTNRYIMYNKNVYIIYKHVVNKVFSVCVSLSLLQVGGQGGHDGGRRQLDGDVVVFTGGPATLALGSIAAHGNTLVYHFHD